MSFTADATVRSISLADFSCWKKYMTLFIMYVSSISLDISRSRIKVVLRSLRFVSPTLQSAFFWFP